MEIKETSSLVRIKGPKFKVFSKVFKLQQKFQYHMGAKGFLGKQEKGVFGFGFFGGRTLEEFVHGVATGEGW